MFVKGASFRMDAKYEATWKYLRPSPKTNYSISHNEGFNVTALLNLAEVKLIKIIEKILTPTGEEKIKDSICLPYDQRKRGRFKTQTITDQEVGIMIDRGDVMRGGTLMRCDAGDVYEIIAADEVVTTATTDDATLFARGCYHLGNRHVSLQVGDGWLRYQNDYVLDDMLIQLGLKVIHEPAPFEPENGAYGDHGGHSHGDDDYVHPDVNEHSHSHSHGHSHSHDHSHDHEH